MTGIYSLAIFLFVLVSADSQAQTKAELRVGVVLPLSKTMAAYGQDVDRGIQLALSNLAIQDPDLASRIKIFKADDESIARNAERLSDELIKQKRVDILIGSVTSPATSAIAKVTMDAGKPLVVPATTAGPITQQGKMIFRSCTADPLQGEVLARLALENLKKKKAAVLYEKNSDYSEEIAKRFITFFEQGGGTVVAKEVYETGATDFSKQMSAIRRKNPQVLIMPGYHPEVIKVLEIVNGMKYPITTLGGDGWDHPDLLAVAGSGSVPHYFLTYYSSEDPGTDVRMFSDSYKEKFNDTPSMLAMMGYDSIMLVSDAFRRANSNLSLPLVAALSATTDAQGVLGRIAVNKNRNALKSLVVMRTKKGTAQFYKRISLAP